MLAIIFMYHYYYYTLTFFYSHIFSYDTAIGLFYEDRYLRKIFTIKNYRISKHRNHIKRNISILSVITEHFFVEQIINPIRTLFFYLKFL